MSKKIITSGNGIQYDPWFASKKAWSVKYSRGEKNFDNRHDALTFYKRQRLPKSLWISEPISVLLEGKHYENT